MGSVVAWLEKTGSRTAAKSLERYGLPSTNAYGISVATLRAYAKQIGTEHRLAMQLWKSGSLEARILASFVADPKQLTLAQMNAWCRDFDNWGTTDTACFTLFDRSPLAWKVVTPWTKQKGEFQKRAGFVMMACLAAHDKTAGDAAFMKFLPMIEKGASDDRNFVKKGVSWALRSIGTRSAPLHDAALELARRLSTSEPSAARWIGKDALRDITRPAVRNKVRAKRSWD